MKRSKAAEALVKKYGAFVGQNVTLTTPTYAALSATENLATLDGYVIGLAERDSGIMSGCRMDMVLQTHRGGLRTIALSRIVECRARQ